jgi:AcrR family transcriptional regulator
MSAPRRRQRLSAGERREKIVQAARTEFLSRGHDGARTRSIARSAGVVESVLYDHFGSKGEIFEAAILTPLEAAVRDLVGGAKAIPLLNNEQRIEVLRGVHVSTLRAMIEIAPLLRVAMTAQAEDFERFYRLRIQPLVDELIGATGVAIQGWQHSDIPPDVIIYTALGSLLALASDASLRGREVDAMAKGAKVAELIFYGLVDRPK